MCIITYLLFVYYHVSYNHTKQQTQDLRYNSSPPGIRGERKKDMDKLTIASRAGKGFYKSYVRNIRLAECRPIEGHKSGYSEKDYFFTYKGKEYRVNEYICPDKNGVVIYSAKFRYELVEL